jgi:hypothetical protein
MLVMKPKNYFVLLFMFVSSFLFAQVDKTALREKEMLKKNHVHIRKKYSCSLLEQKKILEGYKEFDRDGNLILDVKLNSPTDTAEKDRLIYNSNGQLTKEFFFSKTFQLMHYYKAEYSQTKILVDSSFDINNRFVHSTKYLYDQQGRDSVYFYSNYRAIFTISTLDHSGVTNYEEEYGFVYDTVRFFYHADTLSYISPQLSYLETTTYNDSGFVIDTKNFFTNHKINGTINYEYDDRNNRTARNLINSEGRIYGKDISFYDQNNLLIKQEYYQNDMSKIIVRTEFEYTYY